MNMSKTATIKGMGKRVEYNLKVTDTLVTFAKGKLKPAIVIQDRKFDDDNQLVYLQNGHMRKSDGYPFLCFHQKRE